MNILVSLSYEISGRYIDCRHSRQGYFEVATEQSHNKISVSLVCNEVWIRDEMTYRYFNN